MKKILLVALILISFNTQAQFPGKHPEILLNKDVKVIPLSQTLQSIGYSDFHKNDKVSISDKSIKHEILADKNFKVTDIKPYEKYGSSRYILKLEGADKTVFYYDYDPKYDFKYQLEVIGGLQLPEGFYCEDIVIETDKFTGDIRKSSPTHEGVYFLKSTKNGTSTYYLSIKERGATPKVGATGLILLLTNGKRIEKPTVPIDVKVNTGGDGYMYNAFVSLTDEDIKLLSENQITDNRLYVFDGTIKNGQILSEYLKCLTK